MPDVGWLGPRPAPADGMIVVTFFVLVIPLCDSSPELPRSSPELPHRAAPGSAGQLRWLRWRYLNGIVLYQARGEQIRIGRVQPKAFGVPSSRRMGSDDSRKAAGHVSPRLVEHGGKLLGPYLGSFHGRLKR
jgi:hypothetical protein